MTTLYWILEYGKVFFAYMFIMFIWPNVVFRKYLKGKKPYFNFAFCATMQVVIVSTLVLGLGLFHILNQWVFFAIFHGIFLFFLLKNVKISDKTKKRFKYLFTGTYGFKTFLRDVRKFVFRQMKKWINVFRAIMHTHWWEYGILAVIVIYGMIYFTYGAFQDYSYGFGDMYPHNAWIYGLVNGQIFSAGVYPEGMHCVIYAMHTLFGIRIYSCLLFAAGIHISVFLLSAYIYFRQVFRWKYTPVIALTLFLTVDVLCINEIYSMSRLQWSIPQEFGLYTQFLCAAFLAKYLYTEHKKKKSKKDEKSISKAGNERLKAEKQKKKKLTAEEKKALKEEKKVLKAEKKELQKKKALEEKAFKAKRAEEDKFIKKQQQMEKEAIKKKTGSFAMPEGRVAFPTDENTYADAEIVENEQHTVYSKENVQYEVDYNESSDENISSSVKVSTREQGRKAAIEAKKNQKQIKIKEREAENLEADTPFKKFMLFIRRIQRTWVYKLVERVWKDENLLVFALALAASLIIHFYPTIMAFFLCLAFVPMAVHKVFNPRRFLELVVAVIVGLIIAVTPMAGALLSGIQFQGSIGWAVSIIEGEDPEATTTVDENATTEEDETSSEEITGETSSETDTTVNDGENNTSGNNEEISSEDMSSSDDSSETSTGGIYIPNDNSPSLGEKVSSIMAKARYTIEHLDEILLEKAHIVYRRAYIELYRRERADQIMRSMQIAIITWVVVKVLSVIAGLIFRKKRISMTYFDGYFALIVGSVFFMCLYCAGALGLPSLIAGSRLCSVAQLLILGAMLVPVDLVFTGIAAVIKKGIMNVVALFLVAGTYLMVYYSGHFHGYLYYELTRHNGAVMCTYAITESLPKNSYTIVSPVDELYQVIQYGFHEELVEFINSSTDKSYKLPSEYVFIFVEKKPIEYAQSHFFEGPDWLAHEKYAKFYNSYVSQCPDITTSDISDEIAKLPFSKLPVSSKMYSNLETRTVLQSRCYAWCQEFSKMHPNELKVYYEDDNFICYYFRQNPFSLFELAIQDSI